MKIWIQQSITILVVCVTVPISVCFAESESISGISLMESGVFLMDSVHRSMENYTANIPGTRTGGEDDWSWDSDDGFDHVTLKYSVDTAINGVQESVSCNFDLSHNQYRMGLPHFWEEINKSGDIHGKCSYTKINDENPRINGSFYYTNVGRDDAAGTSAQIMYLTYVNSKVVEHNGKRVVDWSIGATNSQREYGKNGITGEYQSQTGRFVTYEDKDGDGIKETRNDNYKWTAVTYKNVQVGTRTCFILYTSYAFSGYANGKGTYTMKIWNPNTLTYNTYTFTT